MSLCQPCYRKLAYGDSSEGTIHQTVGSFLAAVNAECCICRGLFLQLPEDKRDKVVNYLSPEVAPKIWMHFSDSPRGRPMQFVQYAEPGTVTSCARRWGSAAVISLTLKILTSDELYDTVYFLRLPESMRGPQFRWVYHHNDQPEFHDPDFWTTTPSMTLTPTKSKGELKKELRPSSITSDSTFSSETFGKIGTWLNTCANTHDRCNLRRQNTETERLKASWLPTRLVKIIPLARNDHDPSQNMACWIVETRSENTPSPLSYITLSHRWNEHNVEILNKDNLSEWKIEIPLNVSKTFRDAFQVAHKLGISYVWIDSLCIIQKDPEDWKIEAPQMDKVYANATLNICASLDNNMEGLFSTRLPARLAMPEIYVPPESHYNDSEYEGIENVPTNTGLGEKYHESEDDDQSSESDEHSGYFLVAKSAPGAMWEQSIARSSLKDRGWVFQEQLLSSANLYFGSDEVLFECREMRASESLGMDKDYPFKYDSWSAEVLKNQLPMEQGFVSVEESDDTPSNYDESNESSSSYDSFDESYEAHISLYERWYSLLSKYSARQLTHHGDRLIALSAVAQHFKEILPDGDIYIAGLWHSRLGKDMLWRRRKTSAVVKDDNWAIWKERSPNLSFSWISIFGEIEHPNLDYITDKAKVECIYKGSTDQPFTKDIFFINGPAPIAMKITGHLREICLWPPKHGYRPIYPQAVQQACEEDPQCAQYYNEIYHPYRIDDNELTIVFAQISAHIGTKSIHVQGNGKLDFDINKKELATLNEKNVLFAIPLAAANEHVWFLLLLLIDSQEGTFRRIGVYDAYMSGPGPFRDKLLYRDEGIYNQHMEGGWPLKPLRDLPCWRYDEVKKEHTIFVI